MENRAFRVKRMRAQLKRFAPVLFLMIALFSLWFAKSSLPAVEYARRWTLNTVTPVWAVIITPLNWINAGIDHIQDFFLTYLENDKLKQENATLKQNMVLFDYLKMENERLKKQYHYIDLPIVSIVSAPVLSSETEKAQTLLTPAGTKDGIKKGFVALSPQGLVGRVLSTGYGYSRILLLTDLTSRIPVMVGPQRFLALAIGTDEDTLTLTALPDDVCYNIGDEVLTSGHGGVFPAGLRVGAITDIQEDIITVRPTFLKEKIETIQLIDFGLTGLLSEATSCQE